MIQQELNAIPKMPLDDKMFREHFERLELLCKLTLYYNVQEMDKGVQCIHMLMIYWLSDESFFSVKYFLFNV